MLTSTTQANLRRVARALSIARGSPDRMPPVLLEGPPGAGKTASIRHLACALGYASDIIELHLDDVTDGRALLGSYVCTDVPGEFRWQPGAIMQAVTSGRWVVVEDIDRAPFEVLSALAPLFQDRRLVLPGRHEPVGAHPDFQLFATRSTTPSPHAHERAAEAAAAAAAAGGDTSDGFDGEGDYHTVLLASGSTGSVTGPLGAFLHHWLRVPIQPLSTALHLLPSATSAAGSSGSSELAMVLQARHPRLPPSVVQGMLVSFQLMQLAHGAGGGSGAASGGTSLPGQLLQLLPPSLRSLSQYGRTLSPRDLLKWARRIEGLTDVADRADAQAMASASSAADVFLPDRTKEAILSEAIAVFGGHLPSPPLRSGLGRALAAVWGLSDDTADALVRAHKPDAEALPAAGPGAPAALRVGRVVVPAVRGHTPGAGNPGGSVLPRGFAPTRHGLQLLERVSACVAMREPALLVGETGNGKTSAVQVLADAVGARLSVINLNMQTDSSDLLGGFKPVHLKQLGAPLASSLLSLFKRTFSGSANEGFLVAIEGAALRGEWGKLSKGAAKAIGMATAKLGKTAAGAADPQLGADWAALSRQLAAFDRQRSAIEDAASSAAAAASSSTGGGGKAAAFAFQFVEGALVTAVRTGHWVLLDEINLASPETLQRLAGLLEGGGITLTEKGDADRVAPHPSFRLFGAMNPATDAGKRELPPALRSRFTEVWVDDVEDRDDLAAVVAGCLAHIDGAGNNAGLVGRVVDFYLAARALCAPRTGVLRDGGGGQPHYSLRSLTRALKITGDLMASGYPLDYALSESLATSFAVQLDEPSARLVMAEIHRGFPTPSSAAMQAAAAPAAGEPAAFAAPAPAGGKKRKKGGAPETSTAAAPASGQVSLRGSAAGRDPSTHVQVGACWLKRGPVPSDDPAQPHPETGVVRYVLVPSVKRHIHSLARGVVSGRFPVLLQGPTSSGKTSMVEYLASLTGHPCVRINNHEHTDLAEYLGTYVSDPSGRLVYTDGLLVTALRRGHWIILDELNLAPSEVLEALNRLLDDNRELFIPETQETLRPAPGFMLFATQNPAGLYGGRKQLSQAFRNRFIEMHVDDLPDRELATILSQRSQLPPSFVEAMVATMSELRRVRQSSNVFAGKHGFVTTRDLLRWASRRPDSYQSLAEEGFTLLAERLRLPAEKATVAGVLERCCRAELDPEALYARSCPVMGEEQEEEAEASKAASEAFTAAQGTEPGGAEPPARKRARLRNSIMPDRSAQASDAGRSAAAPPASLQQLASRPFHALSTPEFHALTTARMGRLVAQLTAAKADPHSQQQQQRKQQRASSGDDSDSDEDEEDTVDLTPGVVPGTEGLSTVSLTRSLRRMFTLIGRCIAHDEPVLLVGDTGCGKTTAVQIFALLTQTPLHVVNCHAHTETADFLGSLRPVRAKAAHAARFREAAARFVALLPAHARDAVTAGLDSSSSDVPMDGSSSGSGSVDLASLLAPLGPEELFQRIDAAAHPDPSLPLLSSLTASMAPADAAALASAHASVSSAFGAWSAMFEWVDGPLVTALGRGDFFLLDEASLAEDAVLERLNSVLEPSRTLTLAEKGEAQGEQPTASSASSAASSLVLTAAPGFRFFATMNPGGDFGKRELSPALRNRFTEVWVPAITHEGDLLRIVGDKASAIAMRRDARLGPTQGEAAVRVVATLASFVASASSPSLSPRSLHAFVAPLVRFVRWFDDHASSGRLVSDEELSQLAEAYAPAPAAADGPSASAPAVSGALTVSSGRSDARARVLTVTLRDLHAWLEFMAAAAENAPEASDNSEQSVVSTMWETFAHGAALVLLDGLGLGTGLPQQACSSIRAGAAEFLISMAPPHAQTRVRAVLAPRLSVPSAGVGVSGGRFAAPPFSIALGPMPPRDTRGSYSLGAPTTRCNLFRLLRALALPKPILLEGSPGVGKSSLIEALAIASGHSLVRINLSEQTDLADLFGQDLPANANANSNKPQAGADGAPADGPASSSSSSARFAWSDGVFLKALKAGHWVLLDELNLASQAVLEGLNAVLDHRATVFIPELGRSFACPPTFRVFATQNPVGQGGGRKGLPKSFLNRFTKTYVQPLGREDQTVIARALFPALDVPLVSVYPETAAQPADSGCSSTSGTLLETMIAFNNAMHRDTMGGGADGESDSDGPSQPLYGAEGRPWEFNLRDLFRWCALVCESACALDQADRAALNDLLRTELPRHLDATHGLDTVYLSRLRSPVDRAAALTRFTATFAAAGVPLSALARPELHDAPLLRVSDSAVAIDDIVLPRAAMPGVWRLDPQPEAGDASAAALRSLAEAAAALSAAQARGATPLLSQPPAEVPPVALGACHATLRHAYQLAACVQHAWPALLVGPASTGKTAAVRSLAALAGAPLREINVTPSTDATELLGCFEQVDAARTRRRVAEPVLGVLRAVAATATHLLARCDGPEAAAPISAALRAVEAAASAVVSAVQAEGADHHPAAQAIAAALATAASVASSCVTSVGPAAAPASLAGDALPSALSYLARWAASQLTGPDATPAGHFEWVDGVLVRALERGEWLLVDNVNFCSPAVIDRLNALLEPGGSLLISECGVDASGSPRLVTAHPSFRVFFAMNAALGDVSRALRNRCVELWFPAATGAGSSGLSAAAAADASAAEFARAADAICASVANDLDGGASAQLESLRAAADGLYRRLIGDASTSSDLRSIVSACGVDAPSQVHAIATLHRRSAAAVGTREGRLFGAAPPSLAHLRRLSEALVATARVGGSGSAAGVTLARLFRLVYAHCGGSLADARVVDDATGAAAVTGTLSLPAIVAPGAEVITATSSARIAAVLAELSGLPALAAALCGDGSLPTAGGEAQLLREAHLLARLAPLSAAHADVRAALIAAAMPEHARPEVQPRPAAALSSAPASLALALCATDLSLSHELAARVARTASPADFVALALSSAAQHLATALRLQHRREGHHHASQAAVVKAAIEAGAPGIPVTALALAALATQATTAAGVSGRSVSEALGTLHAALAPLYAALTHLRAGLLAATASVPAHTAALLLTGREVCRITERALSELAGVTVGLQLTASTTVTLEGVTDSASGERSLDRVVVLYRQLLKALRPAWEQLCAAAPGASASAAQQLALTEALLSGDAAPEVPAAPASASSSSAALLVPRRVKDALWKRGGHPAMPSTQVMASARGAIQSAVLALQERASCGAPPLVRLRHRRVLLDALSTLVWAVTQAQQDSGRAAGSDAAVAALTGTLSSELSEVLSATAAASAPMDEETAGAGGVGSGFVMPVDDSDEVATYGTGETAEAEEKRLLGDIGVEASALPVRRKAALASAAALVECWCLAEERSLMATLWQAYAASAVAAASSAAAPASLRPHAQAVLSVLPRLRAWLGLALGGTSWPVDSLQPHQSLLWACEASAASVEDDGGARLLASLSSVMAAHHASLQVSWHARLGAVKPPPGGTDASSGSGGLSHLLHVTQVAAGFALAVGDISAPDADAALSAPAPASSSGKASPSRSLLGFEASVYRVLMAAGHLAARGGGGEVGAPPLAALASQERAIVRSTLAVTLAAFAPLSSSPSESGEALASWWEGVAPLSWDLPSRDVRFDRLLSSGAVLTASSAVDAVPPSFTASAPVCASLASAWYAVSRLRVGLLAPSSPVDPSAGPRVKAELCGLEHDEAQGALQAVSAASEALRGFPAPEAQEASPPVATLLTQLASLSSDKHRLGSRVIVRHAAAEGEGSNALAHLAPRVSFHGWYRELHGFLRAMVAPPELHATLTSLLQASPASTGASLEQLAEAFRRVSLWEASCLEFTLRSLREYAAFPDATHPALEPLAGLRHALAFARAHAGAVLAQAKQQQQEASQSALVPISVPRALRSTVTPRSLLAIDHQLLAAVAGGVRMSRVTAAGYRQQLCGAVLARVASPSGTPLHHVSALVLAAARYALAQEKGRTAEAAAVASSSGTHSHVDGDEEAKKEAAFRAQFPDFLADHFAHLLPKRNSFGPEDDKRPAKPAPLPPAPLSPVADVMDPLHLAFGFLAGVRGDARLGGGDAADDSDALWAALGRADDDALTALLPPALAPLRSDHEAVALGPGDAEAAVTGVTTLALGALGSLLAAPVKIEPAPAAFRGVAGAMPPLGRRLYNFFRDPNVGEASVAIRPLRGLAARVGELLRAFPRNEVLLLVLRLVHGVLRLPHATPIAGILSGVTLVYAKAHEWEANAASFVSLGPHLRALGALITRWRRLELSCWRYMLQVTAQGEERAAADLWLRLYGFVDDGLSAVLAKAGDAAPPQPVAWVLPPGLAPPPPPTPPTAPAPAAPAAAPSAPADSDVTTPAGLCRAVFEMADRYLRSASLGQVRVRLALVDAVARDLHTRGAAAALAPSATVTSDTDDAPSPLSPAQGAFLRHIGTLLASVRAHYAQYTDALTRALDAAAGPVIKGVSDQVLLHRWDEQSHYALQETADKGHRLVHRATNSYREVLTTPVAPIVDIGYQVTPTRPALPPAPAAEGQDAPGAPILALAAGVQAAAGAAPDASALAARLAALARRMSQLLATRATGGLLAPPAVASRASAASDALDSAGGLSSAWETIRDPEAWKTSKRSVLVGMLRACARQGFSPLSTAVPPAARETHNLLQLPHPLPPMAAGAPSTAPTGLPLHVGPLLASAESDFHRTLDRLIRLRGVIASGAVHADIASHEHRRMAGFGEHVAFTLAQQRTALAVVAPQARALQALIDALASSSSACSASAVSPASLLARARHTLHALISARAAVERGRSSFLRGRKLIKGSAQVLTGAGGSVGADVHSEALVLGVASASSPFLDPVDGEEDGGAGFTSGVNAALGLRLRGLNACGERLASVSRSLSDASSGLSDLLAQADGDAQALADTMGPAELAASPAIALLRDPRGLASALASAADALACASGEVAGLLHASAMAEAAAPAGPDAAFPPLLTGYERGVLATVAEAWPATPDADASATDADESDVAMTTAASDSSPGVEALVQELQLAVQELVRATTTPDSELVGVGIDVPTATGESGAAAAPSEGEAADEAAKADAAAAAAAAADGEEGEEEPEGVPVRAAHVRYLQTLRAFRTRRVAAAALALLAPSSSSSPTVPPAALAMLRMHAASLVSLLADFASFHASCASYGVHATVTFLHLLRQGLCVPPKKDDEKGGQGGGPGGEGGGKPRHDQLEDGTGMGEGSGAQDVSNQITNEEQVLGNKGDKEKNEANAGPEGGAEQAPQPGGDDGIDMGDADFDGTEHDMPQQPQGAGDDGGDDSGEEEDMAREMGSVGADDEQAGVVDEKLWDAQDDEEEKPAEKAKSSKAAPSGPQKKQPGDALRAKEEAGGPPESAGAEEEEGGAEEGAAPQAPDEQLAQGGDAKPPADDDGDDAGGEQEGARGDDGKDQDDDGMAVEDGGDGDDNKPDEQEGGPEQQEKPERMDDLAPRAPERALGDDEAQQQPDEEQTEEAAGGDEQAEDGGDLALDLAKPMQLDHAEEGGQQQPEGDDAEEDEGEGEGQNEADAAGEEEQAPQPEGEDGEDGAGPDDAPAPEAAGQQPEEAPAVSPDAAGGADAAEEDGGAPASGELPQGTPSAGGKDAVKAQPNGGPRPKGEKQPKSAPAPSASPSGEPEGEQGEGEQGADAGDADGADSQAGDADQADQALLPDGSQQPQDSDESGAAGDSEQQPDQQQQQPEGSDERGPPKIRRARDANPYADPAQAMRRWQARVVEDEEEDSVPAPKPLSQQQEQEGGEGAPARPQPSDAQRKQQQQQAESSSSQAQPPRDVRVDDTGGRTMLLPVDEAMPLGTREEQQGEGEDGMPQDEEEGEAQRDGAAAPAPSGDAGAMDVDGEDGEGDSSDDEEGTHKPTEDAAESASGSESRPADAVLRDLAQPSASSSRPPPGGDSTQITVRTGLQSAQAVTDTDRGMDDTGTLIERDDADASAGALLPKDAAALRAEFERSLLSLRGPGCGLEVATQAWGALSSLTAEPAARLCERLRLILEPTLAAKLGGEYRSGKRINMRKVIPYIASQFRKDKIWMRRSTPSKRTYQVVVAVDDSRSMAPGNTGGGSLACEAVALLCKALSRLEVGEIGIVSFGAEVSLLQPLDAPFTDEAGARALSRFTFAQETTRVAHALESVVGLLDASKGGRGGGASASGSGGASQVMQLVFFISDGMLGSGAERARVRRAVTEATARGQLVVLLVVDRAGGGNGASRAPGPASSSTGMSGGDESSILNMQSISFTGGKVVKTSYLDDYPFPYYLVMHDVHALPEVLSDALRQWFEMVARSGPGGGGR